MSVKKVQVYFTEEEWEALERRFPMTFSNEELTDAQKLRVALDLPWNKPGAPVRTNTPAAKAKRRYAAKIREEKK